MLIDPAKNHIHIKKFIFLTTMKFSSLECIYCIKLSIILPWSVVGLSRGTVCVLAWRIVVAGSVAGGGCHRRCGCCGGGGGGWPGRRCGRCRRRRRRRRSRCRGRSVFEAGQHGVAWISSRWTAHQRRALADARRRYATGGRVTAAVTCSGRRPFVVAAVMVLSGTYDVGTSAPGQRVGRVRVVRQQAQVIVVVVRRALWRWPCGRQVGRLLPDQTGRRQVPGRMRSADGAVLIPAAAATAATAAVQRARTAAVRRSHGGCRVRPGQRGRRRRHCVHDRGRPWI